MSVLEEILCAGTPPAELHPGLASPAQAGPGAVGARPEEATEMFQGLDALGGLRLFNLQKGRLWGHLGAPPSA